MMTKLQTMSLSIIIGIALSGLLLFYYQVNKTAGTPGCKRVAILLPVTHHALAQIEQGVVAKLQELMPGKVSCDVFNAQGDRVLLHTLAHDIISKDYDAVVGIATQPSLQLQQARVKAQSTVPFIFTAVSHPEQLGLVDPTTGRGVACAGVTELVTYEQHAQQLARVRPQVTKALLVYDPTQGSGLEAEHKLLAQKLVAVGITLDVVMVHQARDVVTQLRGALADHTAVITLKDNTVHTAFDGIVAFCTEQKLVLVASTLDAVGADIAVGLHEVDYGTAAAVIVARVLTEGITPEQLPLVLLTDRAAQVDVPALARKGFTAEVHHA